ncbi:hypothetical protein [Variovorax arabinosiphilus]|uniref:hypothetical protein n=1 Tax=Variovorax arabinosiphilus TaxID=3053498 RepID=UPI002578B4B1|nr:MULTISPECIES: hypothetical protein [unclassified Variovorax]MDM0122270.1 hypothetical protein [Variovorax sp. J2L1-78]MDM0131201.1 hypothetical protein [Variovorax sp. J2L1-63]MDM0235033.1 hypothetical protein [Variovorax sp. J2R1-6]
MKLAKFVSASGLFVVLTCAIYWTHITFFPVNVVFYSAIFDGVLAALLTGLFAWRLRPFAVFTAFEKWQMLLIWLLTAYALAISVPTVLDRSLSFYILEKLQQRGGGIQENRFSEVFTQEYLKEHRLVDVRLTEQLESGTIRIENGCVRLTEKGRELTTFSRFFRQHLLPKKRLLRGQYSDDLTDPFRHSTAQIDYTC